MAKNKRSKATQISDEVKRIVYERDEGKCIFCKKEMPDIYSSGFDPMHYIRKSHGGLGIPENLGLGCRDCHTKFDFNAATRRIYEFKFKTYLRKKYPNWDNIQLKYSKWGNKQC